MLMEVRSGWTVDGGRHFERHHYLNFPSRHAPLFFPPFRKLSALTSSSVRYRPRRTSSRALAAPASPSAVCVRYDIVSTTTVNYHYHNPNYHHGRRRRRRDRPRACHPRELLPRPSSRSLRCCGRNGPLEVCTWGELEISHTCIVIDIHLISRNCIFMSIYLPTTTPT